MGYQVWDKSWPAVAEDCTVCLEAGLWWRVERWGKGRGGGGSVPPRPFSLFPPSSYFLIFWPSSREALLIDSLHIPFTSQVHALKVDCGFLLHHPMLSLIDWKASKPLTQSAMQVWVWRGARMLPLPHGSPRSRGGKRTLCPRLTTRKQTKCPDPTIRRQTKCPGLISQK